MGVPCSTHEATAHISGGGGSPESNVMITRRLFIGAPAVTLLGRRSESAAQPKVPRSGVLVGAAPPHPFVDAFRRGLRTLGYLEGQNIALEIRHIGGQADRAAELAAELVRLRTDVIVTHFTQTMRAALAAFRTIPIVMVVGAPVESGFVASVVRPGGNATGLSGTDAEIAGKRLQVLRELNPRLERIAILGTTPTTNPYSGPYVEELRRAASTDLRPVPVLIDGPDEFERAFSEMAKAGAQAVIVQDHFDSHRVVLTEPAAKYKLAYMSGTKETAAAGALVSLSPDWSELYGRAAFYVGRILKGPKPETLPVEQATRFQLVPNLKTAKALGLKVPPSLLARQTKSSNSRPPSHRIKPSCSFLDPAGWSTSCSSGVHITQSGALAGKSRTSPMRLKWFCPIIRHFRGGSSSRPPSPAFELSSRPRTSPLSRSQMDGQ